MAIPRVSVIVPFFNSEKTLLACLDSIAGQTLANLELILVNDGSTDGSLTIAKQFADSYAGPCVVLSQPNGGPAAARNKGLDLARGEFIAFVDSDDVIDSTMYEKMVESADKHCSDIVTCGRSIIDASTGAVVRDRVPSYEVLRGSVVQNPCVVRRVGPLMCDKMFRRAIIEENSIRFDEDIWYAEDFLFGTHIKIHSSCVSAVKEPLYRYVQSTTSITGGTDHVMDIIEACHRVITLYEREGYLTAVRDPLLYVLAGYYLRRAKSLSSSSFLWKEYKNAFRALLQSYFGQRWRLVVIKRIVYEEKPSDRFALLLKALA